MPEAETANVESAVLSDEDFRAKLGAVLPALRAFARGLCGDRDLADDLVQETMLKAWAARTRFVADTNFRGWTYTILRNHFLTIMRRKRFVGEWNDLAAERILCAPASQEKSVELGDLMRALQQLSVDQREALVLVAAGGISYEEAAEIAGVAVGTIKSRVSRGRTALENIFASDKLAITRSAFGARNAEVVDILEYLEKLQASRTIRGSAASIESRISIAA